MNIKFQLAWLRDYSGQALIFFASITLFVIMWLTVVDVVSRDAFDISGSTNTKPITTTGLQLNR